MIRPNFHGGPMVVRCDACAPARVETKVKTFAEALSIAKAAGWTAHHRSEEHTSELQSLMRISYAVFCLKKKTFAVPNTYEHQNIRSHIIIVTSTTFPTTITDIADI